MTKDTWTREKDEENGVEEPDCVVYHPLMDHCRDEEGYQLNYHPFLPQRREEPVQVEIHVVVEPVMDYYVPFTVVCCKLEAVPPI